MGLFGPDKMTLNLEGFNYRPGEVIKGVVALNLNKPTKARRLVVSLLGKVKTSRRDADGDLHTQDQTIYEFALPLDGEKEYLKEQYPFEIKIQSDILQSNQPGQFQRDLEDKLGTLGSILGQFAAGQRPVRWMVHAYLDLPMMLDVKKSQDIAISPEQHDI